MYTGLNSFSLLAVPMFMLGAEIMCSGQCADRLLKFIRSLLGHLPGGIAITSIGTCTLFGAVSGSTQATAQLTACSWIWPNKISRRFSVTRLESLSQSSSSPSGSMTAAAYTRPAKGPAPASSQPHTAWYPRSAAARS